jgi:hypothetical protein
MVYGPSMVPVYKTISWSRGYPFVYAGRQIEDC